MNATATTTENILASWTVKQLVEEQGMVSVFPTVKSNSNGKLFITLLGKPTDETGEYLKDENGKDIVKAFNVYLSNSLTHYTRVVDGKTEYVHPDIVKTLKDEEKKTYTAPICVAEQPIDKAWWESKRLMQMQGEEEIYFTIGRAGSKYVDLSTMYS